MYAWFSQYSHGELLRSQKVLEEGRQASAAAAQATVAQTIALYSMHRLKILAGSHGGPHGCTVSQ